MDISIFGLHTDPRYGVNPDVFDPERFNNEGKQTIEKITFLSFGEGARICVGMRMALLQIKARLAIFLSNYNLELSSRTFRNFEKFQVPQKMSQHYFMSEPIGRNWVYLSKL